MRIEIDSSAGVMTLNGVDILLDALDILTDPRPECLYQFHREGRNVIVRQWRIKDVKFPAEQEPMNYGDK